MVSDNDMFSSLSKEWDRLMISVLTGMYEDLLIGGQVDVLTAVHMFAKAELRVFKCQKCDWYKDLSSCEVQSI